MRDGYGPDSIKPFAIYDQKLSLWKTCQDSEKEDSVESLVIWPKEGIMLDGLAYDLPILVRLTEESESLLLPTPAAQEPGGTQEQFLARKNRDGSNRTESTHLSHILPLLPTPTGDDANNVTRVSGTYNSLAKTTSLLPTPQARDHKGDNQRRDQSCLQGALLPTITANDSRASGNRTPNGKTNSGTSLTDLLVRGKSGEIILKPSEDGN